MTVALKLWALCEVCCRGGLPLVAGGFGSESRVVLVMFVPLFCSRLARYMFWREMAKAMQICWYPDRDYLTVCVVHSLCISPAPAVFAYVGNKEDLQVGAPEPMYPLNFNLRCVWISTSLCMRMNFPHITCFYFALLTTLIFFALWVQSVSRDHLTLKCSFIHFTCWLMMRF